ncbi:MAG TPA: TetR/AcrR family transcriptional regulator [Polyangiaceae bacterium]|nr:TetR/AcrR family transcriptional regulator [Polyangiaceae bacterium]
MNRATSRQPSRRDEARALFRNAILDSAEAVFAQRGFHGARIQDIAARARTAVGTVYNHFEDKDDVLHALLEERTEQMLEQLRLRPGDPTPFRGRLEARVGRLLAYVSEHRAFFAIANEHGLFAGSATPGAGGSGRALKRVERFRALFRALVQEGVASGDLERIEGDALVRFLGGTIRAFVLSSLAQGGADAKEQAHTVVDLFLHGASRRGTKRTR